VHCTKISAEFECGGHSPLDAHPQKCGVRLRRWEISASYLVIVYYATIEAAVYSLQYNIIQTNEIKQTVI